MTFWMDDYNTTTYTYALRPPHDMRLRCTLYAVDACIVGFNKTHTGALSARLHVPSQRVLQAPKPSACKGHP